MTETSSVLRGSSSSSWLWDSTLTKITCQLSLYNFFSSRDNSNTLWTFATDIIAPTSNYEVNTILTARSWTPFGLQVHPNNRFKKITYFILSTNPKKYFGDGIKINLLIKNTRPQCGESSKLINNKTFSTKGTNILNYVNNQEHKLCKFRPWGKS